MSNRHPIAMLRGLFAGSRFLLCTFLGVIVFLLLPDSLRLTVRLAASWVVGVALFLGLCGAVIVGATPDLVRRRARLLDERRWVILALIVAAAAVSLLALGFTLQRGPGETAAAVATRVILAGLTVVASWTLAHTMFAFHYAHHYYGDGPAPGDDDRGGLAFPGEQQPDYWDFLYFSFVIGMTCQVSDVQVTSRAMRRLALVHGVLAFFFNAVILALAVNLLASSL